MDPVPGPPATCWSWPWPRGLLPRPESPSPSWLLPQHLHHSRSVLWVLPCLYHPLVSHRWSFWKLSIASQYQLRVSNIKLRCRKSERKLTLYRSQQTDVSVLYQSESDILPFWRSTTLRCSYCPQWRITTLRCYVLPSAITTVRRFNAPTAVHHT